MVVYTESYVSIGAGNEVGDEGLGLLGRLMMTARRWAAVIIASAYFHHLHAGLYVVTVSVVD